MRIQLFIIFMLGLLLCFSGSAISKPSNYCQNKCDANVLQKDEDTPGPDTGSDTLFRQRGRRGGGPMVPGGPNNPDEQGEKGRRGFEQLRMLKLMELLNLSDSQEGPFLSLFREMRREQRSIEIKRRDVVEEIAKIVKQSNPDEKKLNELFDRLKAIEDERQLNMKGHFEKVRGILTPVQLGQFVVFQDRFDAAVINFMREGGKHNLKKEMQDQLPKQDHP